MIIHLNGMPGVGKLTVAKLLAGKLNARLLDNHLLIDFTLALCDRGSPEYFLIIKKLMDIALAQVENEPDKTYIFTNALAAEIPKDRERFEQLSEFAQNHKIPFVQVLLLCELAENKNRLISENRKLKGKLMNPDELEPLYQNYTIYHPPGELTFTVETTNLSAEEVSSQIINYLENLKTV